jgi:hypothetical protein
VTSITKSSPKEIAYRRGRKDERQRLIDELQSWELHLLTSAKDLDAINAEMVLIFAGHIEGKIRRLKAAL